MSKGLIDLFKDFHFQAVEERYPASSRALYNFFIGELNRRYWATDELSYSERELAELVGLSKSAVHITVKFLSDRGWIKTSRDKVKTRTFFKIVAAQSLVTSSWADCGQIVGSSSVLNYAHAKDKEDLKTEDKEEEDARARGKILPLSVNSDAVNQVWSECNGEHLKGGKAALMIQLEKSFGTQKLIEAIRQAYYAHDYERFGAQLKVNLVKAILENLQEGGEKRGNNRASRTSSESSYYNVDCANQPLPPGY